MDYKPTAIRDLAERMRKRTAPGEVKRVPAARVMVNHNRIGQFKTLASSQRVTVWFSIEHDTLVLRRVNHLQHQSYHGTKAREAFSDIKYYLDMGLYRWEVRDQEKLDEVNQFLKARR